MKLAGPFAWRGEHIAIELPGAVALFTTRHGGVSAGPYSSLNLGTSTGDAPENFAENVARVERACGVRLSWGPQVHGAQVTIADRERVGAQPEPADARVTATAGVAPMVRTADCLPVIVAGGGAVAAVHAGWGGLLGEVIAAGVRAVAELGRGGPLAAAIGPGAGACCYRVGEELHERFAAVGQDLRRGPNLDLGAIARAQLFAAGVQEVHDLGLCTICDQEGLFYSHRREHGLTGRQAGLAWLS